MRIQAGVALVLLFFLSNSCSEQSLLDERLVKVHFSPAISLEEAVVYAKDQNANISQYELSQMIVVESDLGKAVEYREPGDQDIFKSLCEPCDRQLEPDIEPDSLAALVVRSFLQERQFCHKRWQERLEEGRQIEEDLVRHMNAPSAEETLLKKFIEHGLTEEVAREKIDDLNQAGALSSNELQRLERSHATTKAISSLLEDCYNDFSFIKGTYVEHVRVESLVLRVRAFQYLKKRGSVARLERL